MNPSGALLRLTILVFLPTVAALTTSAGADARSVLYRADPISAWLVDRESGEPVAGANVIAAWELKGGLEGGNIIGYVTVMETITDSNGQFSFPGWGPKPYDGRGVIRSGAPKLIFFKTGYHAGAVENRVLDTAQPDQMRSDWDNQKIPFPRFRGSLELYAQRLAVLDGLIDSLLNNGQCNWKFIPIFLYAVEQQNKTFVQNGTSRQLRQLSYLSSSYSNQCGSLEQYVQEHAK